MIKVIALKDIFLRNKAIKKDEIIEITHAEYLAKQGEVKIVEDTNPSPTRKVTKVFNLKRTK